VSADPTPVAHITGVSGGEVLAMEYAAVDRLADRCAQAALDLLGWCELPTRTLADPDLLASAVLAPVSFARAEAALGATLLGPEALPCVAAECGTLAGSTVAARQVIELADSGEVQRLWIDATEMLPPMVPVLPGVPSVPPGLPGIPGIPEMPEMPLTESIPLAAAGAAGVLTTLLGPGRAGALSDQLSTSYGPETPVLTTPVSPSPATAGTAVPPRSVTDLVTRLGQLSTAPDGDVEVQTLTAADGSRRHVVYLPGTDDMNPLSSDRQLRDMQENVRLVGGKGTAYAAGVLTALEAAGVRPGEPVLLTGHSQGGMVAVALAAQRSPYDVTNVVTFGSPTAQAADLPADVQVLSLEHDGDLVPQLAGVGHPSAEHVTVHFDSGIEGVAGNHSFPHYTAGAEAVDASTDPDVVRSVKTLAGYFAPGQAGNSQLFQLTRDR